MPLTHEQQTNRETLLLELAANVFGSAGYHLWSGHAFLDRPQTEVYDYLREWVDVCGTVLTDYYTDKLYDIGERIAEEILLLDQQTRSQMVDIVTRACRA